MTMMLLDWYAEHYILGTILVFVIGQATVVILTEFFKIFRRDSR